MAAARYAPARVPRRDDMDLDRLLARLGVKRPGRLDAAALAELHEAHLLAVPFENLSIGWGEPIGLDEAGLFRKIVEEGRGGGCYELNTLFAWLLRGLGFEVELLSARVHVEGDRFGPHFDHLALRVRASGVAWLADVGFGDSFRRPLVLTAGSMRGEWSRTYALCAAGDELELACQEGAGPWRPQYRVDLRSRRLDEFADMLRYHQTAPDAPFTRRRVCTRALPDGRITLSDRKLTRTHLDGGRSETPIPDDEAFAHALVTHFGIRAPAPA